MAIQKLPGGVEDLTFGVGTEQQQRKGSIVTITQINGAVIPYSRTISLNQEIERVGSKFSAIRIDLDNHKANKSNPHEVTIDDINADPAGSADIVRDELNAHKAASNPHSIIKNDIGLSNVNNTSDLNKPISIATQVELALRYKKADHIVKSAGSSSAGKPIILNNEGKVDTTLLGKGIYFVAMFTPTTGAEYPDAANEDIGAYWSVTGVDATVGYTFEGGDLVGEIIFNDDDVIKGSQGWGIIHAANVSHGFYKLDGSIGISAPFAGGGQVISNIADGIDETDAASLSQVMDVFDAIVNHEAHKDNPHTVTKSQVGLGAVPNLDTTTAVAHVTLTNNPHTVTKSQVGLGNVDNTSDVNKPISTATQTALDAHEALTNNPHSVTASQVGAEPTISLGTAGQVLATNASEDGKNWISLTYKVGNVETGTTPVVTLVSCTQAEYDALTPVATTLYAITG